MELRTYYVSSEKGNDQNDGKSELTPFATLEPLQKCELQPGDKILLERGSVFEDQYLHIRQSGMKDAPIEVGAYGEGCLPKIHANGTGKWYQDYGRPLDSPVHVYRGEVSSAILLYDAEYIWIHDLEITNQDSEKELEQYCAPDKMDRTGVAVVAQNRGTLHDIHLSNLMIHDVNGNVYNKHMNNGGIYMTAFQPEDEAKTGVARYDGVLVEDCSVWRVSRWGIAVGYTYQHERFAGAELAEELFTRYGHENIVLRNNYVKEAGGDAITPMYALRPLTEHNSADSCACEMNDHYYRYPGERMGKVAAGIWPWKCKDALFRYNSVRDMKLNQDGKTVAAMDCLVPGIGEIIGGSQREDDYDLLRKRMEEVGLDEENYQFYLDLRKYGSTHHSGFGLGFERCVMYLTGISNIRDAIPFPRTVNNCEL